MPLCSNATSNRRTRTLAMSDVYKAMLDYAQKKAGLNQSATIRSAFIAEAQAIKAGERNEDREIINALRSVRLSFTVSKESEDALKTVCDFYGSSNVCDMFCLVIRHYQPKGEQHD